MSVWVCSDKTSCGNSGVVHRAAPGIVHHYTCHYHPPISSIIIGDYKLMRHLNSGELKLFNIKTDYQEQVNLAAAMPGRAESMDAVRANYVKEVNGGTATQVRDALYDLMDEFGERAKAAYRKKLAILEAEMPVDFDLQKAALLRDLNKSLYKNELNKERCRRQAKHPSWRDSAPKQDAEEFVRSNWVDYTGD